MLGIDLAGERVHLLPERALWWPAGQTLYIADVHLGKASTFRARGVPLHADLCAAIARRDLDVLAALLDQTSAKRLVILGDLLHAPEAQNPDVIDVVSSWRASKPAQHVDITLVRGNHDLRAGDPPAQWRIQPVPEGRRDGPFLLVHHPELAPEIAPEPTAPYTLAGHIHPSISLVSGPSSERAPCFWFRPRVGVLPAFGRFTGTARIHPDPHDRLFAVGITSILPIPIIHPRTHRPA